MDAPADAAASFIDKWCASNPELAIALRFLPAGLRQRSGVLAAIEREIVHAAATIGSDEVAATKLGWWHDELTRSARGEARHPLTQALAIEPASAGSLPAWRELVPAALVVRARETASRIDDLLAAWLPLYRASATIESALSPVPLDIDAAARASALSHLLRDVARIDELLAQGQLPLPLDVMARHRLSRDTLRGDSPPRRLALADACRALADEMAALLAASPRLGLVRHAGLVVDRRRAAVAARSDDPSVTLSVALQRTPLRSVWSIWRVAQRDAGA